MRTACAVARPVAPFARTLPRPASVACSIALRFNRDFPNSPQQTRVTRCAFRAPARSTFVTFEVPTLRQLASANPPSASACWSIRSSLSSQQLPAAQPVAQPVARSDVNPAATSPPFARPVATATVATAVAAALVFCCPPAFATAGEMSSVEWELIVPSLIGVSPAGALIAATATAGTLCLGFVLFIAVGVLFQPRWIISWVQQNQPHTLFEHVTQERLVALTIDDGPNGYTTHQLLDILKEHECHATFFVIGSNIDRYPEIVDRMHAEGHELGNHMTEDAPSWRLPPSEFESSLLAVDGKLTRYFRTDAGGKPVKWFRPGHGWYTKRMRQQVQRHGYNMALGSVFPVDPLFKDSSRPLASYCLWKVYPGAIIILHDRPQQGTQTVEILRTMLPELRRQGYQVVSLSHLVRGLHSHSHSHSHSHPASHSHSSSRPSSPRLQPPPPHASPLSPLLPVDGASVSPPQSGAQFVEHSEVADQGVHKKRD